MKRWLPALALSGILLISGCGSSGSPRAETPETEVDFGNVPVVMSMDEAKLKRFDIKNTGTADLRLKNIRIQVLEGC